MKTLLRQTFQEPFYFLFYFTVTSWNRKQKSSRKYSVDVEHLWCFFFSIIFPLCLFYFFDHHLIHYCGPQQRTVMWICSLTQAPQGGAALKDCWHLQVIKLLSFDRLLYLPPIYHHLHIHAPVQQVAVFSLVLPLNASCLESTGYLLLLINEFPTTLPVWQRPVWCCDLSVSHPCPRVLSLLPIPPALVFREQWNNFFFFYLHLWNKVNLCPDEGVSRRYYIFCSRTRPSDYGLEVKFIL